MNKGSHVKMVGDPMASELLINMVSVSFRVLFNHFADLIVPEAGLAEVDRLEHRLTSYLR